MVRGEIMVEASITITVDHVAAKALLEILNNAEHSHQSGYLPTDCRDHIRKDFFRERQEKISGLHNRLRQVFADDRA